MIWRSYDSLNQLLKIVLLCVLILMCHGVSSMPDLKKQIDVTRNTRTFNHPSPPIFTSHQNLAASIPATLSSCCLSAMFSWRDSISWKYLWIIGFLSVCFFLWLAPSWQWPSPVVYFTTKLGQSSLQEAVLTWIIQYYVISVQQLKVQKAFYLNSVSLGQSVSTGLFFRWVRLAATVAFQSGAKSPKTVSLHSLALFDNLAYFHWDCVCAPCSIPEAVSMATTEVMMLNFLCI